MEVKFYKCGHCGNIVTYVDNKGVKVMCCGEKMTELVANTTDAAKEKHVPAYTVSGNTVTVVVGETAHPMLKEHYIQWVCLQTANGVQIKYLNPDEKPEVKFGLTEGDSVEAVYAYCNLHGLWKI